MHADMSQTGAAFIAKQSQPNPRELILALVESHPGTSKDGLFSKFREEIQLDEAYQRAVDWYFFINMYEYLTTSRNAKTAEQKALAKQRMQERAREIAQRVRDVVRMDILLPNGKRLGDATFADCAKAGGWFTKLAKKGKPGQTVGKVLTEQDLRAIK